MDELPGHPVQRELFIQAPPKHAPKLSGNPSPLAIFFQVTAPTIERERADVIRSAVNLNSI